MSLADVITAVCAAACTMILADLRRSARYNRDNIQRIDLRLAVIETHLGLNGK